MTTPRITQAIVTKVLPATAKKGTRIKATCEAGSLTRSNAQSHLSLNQYHRVVAIELAEKLDWLAPEGSSRRYELVSGSTGNMTQAHVLRQIK